MVECTALEMRRAFTGTVGSNPTLSATGLAKRLSLLHLYESAFLCPSLRPNTSRRLDRSGHGSAPDRIAHIGLADFDCAVGLMADSEP